MNKKILIAIIVVILLGGGFFAWRYFEVRREAPVREVPKKLLTAEEIAKAIAKSFCREKFKEKYREEDFLHLETVYFLNFDEDEKKEILGICLTFPPKIMLFVLDQQNNKYKPVLEKVVEPGMREYVFENLQVKDINQDGIDEIIYEKGFQYKASGFYAFHLYSPKDKEWFWRQDSYSVAKDDEVIVTEIKFSPNLELEEYQIFYEFLKTKRQEVLF